MKKYYEEPEMYMLDLLVEDIMTASQGDKEEGETGEFE